MQSKTHIMKFNHLSFPSRDVPATASFFEQHLDWQVTAMGRSRMLKGYGFDVVIEDAADRPVDWPGNFHIGFELPSLEALRGLYERFQSDGVEFASGLITHERGSRFFCRVPGGVLVELNTREDAAAPFRAGFGLV
ncbi:Catechol 2,3-dioxygenase [Roseateles sp. YR242]|uniref:VOC family protein n=1 Tax=Roseateles sp. YR242 TaxID=1855305 RepID=UPI0008CD3098|nr:VOC family protein [Roseateles sp. YR242]SEK34595.1 Catechol 2,3-dioxygenase [Roseateles sp. YR242]